MKHFNEETAQGMDAHQAELNAIQSVQKLGESMIEQWTQVNQADQINETIKDSNLIKN